MAVRVEYENIRRLVVNTPCSELVLNCLKEHFKDNIDSSRLCDRIKNLPYLVRILEKRDCLNIENMNPLKFIGLTLKRNDIIYRIDNFGCPQKTPEAIPDRVLPVIETDPVERIYRVISSEIGHKWKDLARALELKEGYIDELEHKYRNISDMVIEILHYHKERSDERYWKVLLFQALESARRKDLSLKVQNILAMHSM